MPHPFFISCQLCHLCITHHQETLLLSIYLYLSTTRLAIPVTCRHEETSSLENQTLAAVDQTILAETQTSSVSFLNRRQSCCTDHGKLPQPQHNIHVDKTQIQQIRNASIKHWLIISRPIRLTIR